MPALPFDALFGDALALLLGGAMVLCILGTLGLMFYTVWKAGRQMDAMDEDE
jgi:hypothetical protein